MPSIHRQPGRPFWFCAFSIFNPETRTSRRVFRSTKTSDKKQALEICRAWHKAALKARNGKLSVDAAREVIAQGVSDVFTAANVESLPSASIKSWCETWLAAKAIEAEETTHARYKRVIERFTGFLGDTKSKRDEHTSELQSPCNLVCRLLLEKKSIAVQAVFVFLVFVLSVDARHAVGIRVTIDD